MNVLSCYLTLRTTTLLTFLELLVELETSAPLIESTVPISRILIKLLNMLLHGLVKVDANIQDIRYLAQNWIHTIPMFLLPNEY